MLDGLPQGQQDIVVFTNEDEPTLVFEIRQGRGIFTFLMFFQKRILNQKISCLFILEIQMYLLQ